MDNEVKGEGNSIAYEFRIFDARLGRFISADPREPEYPWQSTYAYFSNSPISIIDYLGGGKDSRHLDKDGKVIAEYDDKDNSVYKHQTAKTKEDVDRWRKHFKNTSGNGIKIGTMTGFGLGVFSLPNFSSNKHIWPVPMISLINNKNSNSTKKNKSKVPMPNVQVQKNYDIDEAVDYLEDNATVSSRHICAKVVRLALEEGGINTNPHPISAKDYGPYLSGWGFRKVSKINYSPVLGDIRVFQPYKGGSIHGHIDMYSDTSWLSDFREKNEFPGNGYKNSTYEIFRWED